MSHTSNKDEFVSLLTSCQIRLYAYILSLTGDINHADDVLQKTNLTLWQKSDEFTPGTNFNGWACKTAHFEVLAHRRDLGRDRHLFDDGLLRTLADETQRVVDQTDDRRLALMICLKSLTSGNRDLIRCRYEPSSSIERMAKKFGRSKSAIVSSLFRIRKILLECVQQKIAGGVEE